MSLHSFAAPRVWFAGAGLAAAMTLAGCGEAKKELDDGYKKQFVDSFVKSCQVSASESGAPADIAATVCRCAADELVAKYGPAQLMSLSDDKAVPVMKTCAKRAGLEV